MLHRRMLHYNVERNRGWSQEGASCEAAGGGREEHGRESGREGRREAVVRADPSSIVYFSPAQDLR